MEDRVNFKKLDNGSSDHVPIVCILKDEVKNKKFEKKILKRSMRNFTKTAWNECFSKKDWSFVEEEDLDLNQMAEKLSKTMDEALDEIAPFKSFTVRSQHKFGLSDRTKNLMKITEVWKACQEQNHPLKIVKVKQGEASCLTRSVANGDLKEFGKMDIVQSTYLSDACKVWNNCPKSIKECVSIWAAKKAIKTTLPI